MTLVSDIIAEWQSLSIARLRWETYWRNIAMYVLPQTESFDNMISQNKDSAIASVVSYPVAAEKSKDLYDMTSLWGIERLTAGMISLKTPETSYWHDNSIDSYFGEEPTNDEKLALEKLRNYQFKVRSNPKSGFWPAHRSAIKSMCGFGDGWMFIKEQHGKGPETPYLYQYMPLIECHPGMGPNGQPNRMFRAFRRSADQIVREFGADNVSPKVRDFANDGKKRHDRFLVLHAVQPRDESDQAGKLGAKGAAFASYYCLPEEKYLIGESGFYEFPFTRYAWSNSGTQPFSEGPVAYAIGEIKSMQEMAKNELLATAAVLRPPIATVGRNFTRINWNAGATNPGLIAPDGHPLFQAMNTGVRPDFAKAVMEGRRNSIREMLYLNLWQIILQDKNDTATEALIRAQEKGELLGPVGISLNEGLSVMVDREIAILSRKKAFDNGSPLAMPDSAHGKNVTPSFTSPLDRLRRMGELVGMQRLAEFGAQLAMNDPQRLQEVAARFDIDDMLDTAQEILGAPVSSLKPKDDADEQRGQNAQQQQMMTALAALKGGGDAAQSVGAGGQALAAGAAAVKSTPQLAQMAQQLPVAAQAAQQAVPGGMGGPPQMPSAVPGQ